MTRRRLCISSFQDWTGAALNRSKLGLIDHVGIGSVPQNNCWNSLRQHYSCLSQLSWYYSHNCMVRWHYIGLRHHLQHQRNQALRGVSPLVSQEERERLRTAPFGALSLFDELATKLQLRDKVASQQRDCALYRGSAQFTVGKTRATPHRSAPARSAPQWQTAMPLSFSRQQPFLTTRGRG